MDEIFEYKDESTYSLEHEADVYSLESEGVEPMLTEPVFGDDISHIEHKTEIEMAAEEIISGIRTKNLTTLLLISAGVYLLLKK